MADWLTKFIKHEVGTLDFTPAIAQLESKGIVAFYDALPAPVRQELVRHIAETVLYEAPKPPLVIPDVPIGNPPPGIMQAIREWSVSPTDAKTPPALDEASVQPFEGR